MAFATCFLLIKGKKESKPTKGEEKKILPSFEVMICTPRRSALLCKAKAH